MCYYYLANHHQYGLRGGDGSLIAYLKPSAGHSWHVVAGSSLIGPDVPHLHLSKKLPSGRSVALSLHCLNCNLWRFCLYLFCCFSVNLFSFVYFFISVVSLNVFSFVCSFVSSLLWFCGRVEPCQRMNAASELEWVRCLLVPVHRNLLAVACSTVPSAPPS